MPKITNDIEYILVTTSRAIAIHRRLRSRVDFQKQDRAHALYLLGGGCLTNVVIACEHYARGHQNHVMQTVRFVFETRALAAFFVGVKDDDRRLKAWFEGKIVKAPSKPGRRGNAPVPLGPPPEDPEKFAVWLAKAKAQSDDVHRALYDEYSKSQHSTIDAVRFNMHSQTHEFDYNCGVLAMLPLRNMDLEASLLVPSLQTVWTTSKLGLLTDEEFRAVREMIRNTELRAHGWSSLSAALQPPQAQKV